MNKIDIHPCQDVINDMTYSPFGAGVATIDHENIVKVYSASPSMLGRGHSLLESGGPVWVIIFSI
jgi:transcription factor C subunit 6